MPLNISTLVGRKKEGSTYKHIEIERVDSISQLAELLLKISVFCVGGKNLVP